MLLRTPRYDRYGRYDPVTTVTSLTLPRLEHRAELGQVRPVDAERAANEAVSQWERLRSTAFVCATTKTPPS